MGAARTRRHDVSAGFVFLKPRPAAVLVAGSSSMLAAALEQMGADFRAGVVQLDGVQPLDLDDAETPQAFDPQDLAADVAEPASQILRDRTARSQALRPTIPPAARRQVRDREPMSPVPACVRPAFRLFWLRKGPGSGSSLP